MYFSPGEIVTTLSLFRLASVQRHLHCDRHLAGAEAKNDEVSYQGEDAAAAEQAAHEADCACESRVSF